MQYSQQKKSNNNINNYAKYENYGLITIPDTVCMQLHLKDRAECPRSWVAFWRDYRDQRARYKHPKHAPNNHHLGGQEV